MNFVNFEKIRPLDEFSNSAYAVHKQRIIDYLLKSRGQAQIEHEKKLKSQQYSVISFEENNLKQIKGQTQTLIFEESRIEREQNIKHLTKGLSENLESRVRACDNDNRTASLVKFADSVISDQLKEHMISKRNRALERLTTELNQLYIDADCDTKQRCTKETTDIAQQTLESAPQERSMKHALDQLLTSSLSAEEQNQRRIESEAIAHLTALEKLMHGQDLSVLATHYELHARGLHVARLTHDVYRENVKMSARVAVMTLLAEEHQ